jgi:hypothetical protein
LPEVGVQGALQRVALLFKFTARQSSQFGRIIFSASQAHKVSGKTWRALKELQDSRVLRLMYRSILVVAPHKLENRQIPDQ